MEKDNLNDVIARIEKLEKIVFGSPMKKNVATFFDSNNKIDFSINERAFVKRYTTDKSGPKKFTLMIAYLAKGEVDKNIQVSELKKLWSKMTTKSLLGAYNQFYPNDAKTRGWIDSKEHGSYNLTNEWENIL
jgi:hypothetical protein